MATIKGWPTLPDAGTTKTAYVPPGMPPLDLTGRTTSFFEFWPMWLMYLPVVLQWLLQGLRHGSLTVPLLANPAIHLSGLVGVRKSAVFDAAGDYARGWILPWTLYEVTDAPAQQQCGRVLALLQSRGLSLPIVGKPDIGCRGAGVKLLTGKVELERYLGAFPAGGSIQFQQLSQWDAEAGVFYVRYPDTPQGEVVSLTLKYTPYVVGDGELTLAQLVSRDPRAGELLHLYRDRHGANWDRVIPRGEPYRLVFSASHCRGAVFRDGSELINKQFAHCLDRIFEDIPGFHYGRLDIKFRDLESLRAGCDFDIIEINGASAESINIWDRNAGLGQAFGTLLRQYRTLFKLGVANRRRGHKPPGLAALWRAWRYEINLVKQYPQND